MIKAVILDLDGVLGDLCAIHRAAFRAAGAEFGLLDQIVAREAQLEGRPTRVKLSILGVDHKHTVEEICERKQALTLNAIDEYVDPNGERGAMCRELVAAGLRLGMYSNSVSETVSRFLRQIHVADLFDAIISNEDVLKPKPHPEGYFTAMRHLGVDPSETLIIEDSLVGLKAACATGARVLPTTFETLTLEEVLACCNS